MNLAKLLKQPNSWHAHVVTTLAVFVSLFATLMPGVARAIDPATAKLVNLGFQVFTTTTFNGNGRTCSTCHLPSADFSISAADFAALSAHQKSLVLASSTLGLENPTMVSKLGVFNINDKVGNDPAEVGTSNTPVGPFRASMSVGALALTTANLLPDFCADNSPPELIENGTDLVAVVCDPPLLGFPNNATAFAITDVFLNTAVAPFIGNLTPGVDDGTRNIELGWAGDGALTDPDVFGASTTLQNKDCRDAVDNANNNITDLTATLRAFSLAAVKTHFPKSLNRAPGVDFRCPTSVELDELAAFQEYLGRRFELALKAGVPTDANDGDAANSFAAGTQIDPSQPVITFNDATAEKGKSIFLDGNSQCNLCHFNAGANDATGLSHAPNVNDPSAPFPGRNFVSKQLVDMLRCTDASGSPTTCMNGATATAHGLNALVAPIVFPQDPGDHVANGATALSLAGSDCNSGINNGGNTGCINGSGMKAGAMNLQPLIEAARKKSFFHNGAFTTLEGALSFYFSPTGDLIKAFNAPRKGETGAVALSNMASTYFSDPTDTKDVLGTMGFFLRSLSSVYAIADCERLMSDSISLVQQGQPVTLQAQLCTGELNDVTNLINGAQIKVPSQYVVVARQAQQIQPLMNLSAAFRLNIGLEATLHSLQAMRHSIATITPDLPN